MSYPQESDANHMSALKDTENNKSVCVISVFTDAGYFI